MVSRRDALKLSAAGLAGIQFVGASTPSIAKQGDPDVWNWMGNAGHTGEMPGPGLNFSGALGEIWRLPGTYQRHYAALLNSILVAVDGFQNMPKSIGGWRVSAFNCNDGAQLWTWVTPGFEHLTGIEESAEWIQTAITVSLMVAVLDETVLLTLGDGRILALTLSPGDIIWELKSGYDVIGPPSIIGSTAVAMRPGGVISFSVADPPLVIWDVDIDGTNLELLGIESNLVWLIDSEFLIALDLQKGTEYWRVPFGESRASNSLGLLNGIGLFHNSREDAFQAMDATGEIAWSLDDSTFDTFLSWIAGDSIARATEPVSLDDFKTCQLQCLFVETGNEQWWFQIDAQRWWLESNNYEVAICEGNAYALVRDKLNSENLLVCVDPTALSIYGARNINLDPKLVSGGFLIAEDIETEELVCVGPTVGTLRPGGRAMANRDTTIYGASNTSSIIRGSILEGESLTLTTDPTTTSTGEWVGVAVSDSSLTGWVSVDSLIGLDGDIVFQEIGSNEFGHFVS